MSLVEVIVVKIKREGFPRQQKDLPKQIIYFLIMSAMTSAIPSAIPPKTSAIT